MITLGIQSLINWSVHNYAGDNIWEYNKARLWSHLVLEDTGGPVREKGRPNLGDFASSSREKAWHPKAAPSEHRFEARGDN